MRNTPSPQKDSGSNATPTVLSDGSNVSMTHEEQAFRREASIALGFDVDQKTVRRMENLKTFIVKVLLFIGAPPVGRNLAVIARVLEVMVLRPEFSPDEVMDIFAATHECTLDAINRIVSKSFNTYDMAFCDRVSSLTGSSPMTPKDVLSDLSIYIRYKQFAAEENWE